MKALEDLYKSQAQPWKKTKKRHAVASVYHDIAFIRNNFLGVFDNN